MLEITGHIFVVIGIGYVAVRLRLIPGDGVRVLSAFALYIALPALIFKSTSERRLDEILHPEYLLACGAASLIAFAAVYFCSRRVLREGMTRASVFAMGGSFSNSLMIGYPIIAQRYDMGFVRQLQCRDLVFAVLNSTGEID